MMFIFENGAMFAHAAKHVNFEQNRKNRMIFSGNRMDFARN